MQRSPFGDRMRRGSELGLMPPIWRSLLRHAVWVTLVLAALWLNPADGVVTEAQTARIEGPFIEAPISPSHVDLRTLPPGRDMSRPEKPRLRPGGKAQLDQEKAAAALLAPGKGIQVAIRAGAAPLTTSTGVGFDGINSGESFCGCYPPDGAVAAGPNHLVAAVNTAFKIWDKTGTVVLQAATLGSLFSSNPSCLSNVSDPFADYDGAGDRFIVGALTYTNNDSSVMCIAVSQTGDPTTTWNVYAFTVTPNRNLLDFPHVAIGSNAIYLAGNQFQNGSSFTGARVYAYNKAQMYAGTPASSVFFNVGNNAAGNTADTVYPARAVGPSNTMYFIAADNFFCGSCSSISLWKWTDPFGASSFTLRGGVTV